MIKPELPGRNTSIKTVRSCSSKYSGFTHSSPSARQHTLQKCQPHWGKGNKKHSAIAFLNLKHLHKYLLNATEV